MPTPLPKLAAPAQRALAGAKVASLEALAKKSEAEVAALHGMGPDAMATLKAALGEAGLKFRR
jgi:predicted Fe-Mo cluster-binding NifX family protein